MKRNMPSFLCGFACAALTLALGTSALAASGQVTFNFANVSVDGRTAITAGNTITAANGQSVPSSILYTDAAGGKTNYLPIRAISELLGVEVDYDSATKTVLLGDQPDGTRKWQRTVEGSSVRYVSEETDTVYTAPPGWCLDLTEAGGTLEGVIQGRSNDFATWKYRYQGKSLRLSCSYPSGGSYGTSLATEEAAHNPVSLTMQGCPAEFYTDGHVNVLVWENVKGLLFWLSGTDLSQADMTAAAEQVCRYTGPALDYRARWLPSGCIFFESNVLSGAVQTIWNDINGNPVSLLYAACPVTAPDGESRETEVNGSPARFWAAKEQAESHSTTVNGEPMEGNTVEVGNVVISTGTIPGTNSKVMSTLMWEDEEAGVFFRLQGAMDLDTLVRIAEHVEP